MECTDAERRACEVRLRAERRTGELLKELARAQTSGLKRGPLSNDATTDASPYAEALNRTGISRQSAHRYQALADVLRAIRRLECSEEFAARNFADGSYPDAQSQMRPAYRMTRDGFTFLAMGFTGKEAATVPVRYWPSGRVDPQTARAIDELIRRRWPPTPRTRRAPRAAA